MSKARDAAVQAYMIDRQGVRSVNPRTVFAAGWDAAIEAQSGVAQFRTAPREYPVHDEVRSSGWVSGPIV